MLKPALLAFALLALILTAPEAWANPPIGEPAPVFKTTDIQGNAVDLAALKGQTVILEWTNNGCPFVAKHYNAGNMQATQRQAIAQGAVWITIISSGPGRQGYVTPQEAQKIADARDSKPSHQILDPSGEIGHLYGAQTTPHMFIIDKEGTLVYKGAIDDRPSPNPKTLQGAKNYVLAALEDMNAGRSVVHSITPPYGCSVKYAP